MSRITLVDVEQQPEPVREFMVRSRAVNVLRVLANAPDVFVGWVQMVGELFESPTFSPRTRELVILRVARLQNSRYELGHHIVMALDAGLTEDQISAIVETDDFDAADFDDTERALLDVVTELCVTRRLSEASFAKAHGIFGDEVIAELLMLVGCYYGLALVLNAVDVEVDAR
jgi:4-carboxymuconolactone decarboxylase